MIVSLLRLRVYRKMRVLLLVLLFSCVILGGTASDAANSIAFTVPVFRGVYIASAVPVTMQYEYTGPNPPPSAYLFFLWQSNGQVTTCPMNTTAVFTGSAGSSHELSFTFNAATPAASSPYISACSALPDGSYDISIGVRFDGSPTITNTSSQLFTIDGVTGIPTLVLPASGTNVFTGHIVSAQFRVPELPSLSSLRLKLFGTGALAGHVYNLTLSFGVVFPSTTYLVSFDIRNPTASSTVSAISGTGSTIPEGVYTFEFSYQDASGNDRASASFSPVKIDTFTQAPSLTGWVSNGRYGNPTTVAFTLPEAPFSGSVIISFYDVARAAFVKYIQFYDDQSVSYSWNRNAQVWPTWPFQKELVLSAGLTDGLYNIELGYSDTASNPKNTSTAYNVLFDSVTVAPVAVSVTWTPATETITATFRLPEKPYNNRATVTFTHNSISGYNRVVVFAIPTSYTPNTNIARQIKVTAPYFYADVISISPNTTILEGSYTAQVSYQDLVLNPAAFSSSLAIGVDYTTLPITNSQPATGYTYTTPFVLAFTVPESPLNGRVTATFKRSGHADIVVVLSVTSSGAKTIQLTTSNIASSPSVVSTTSSTLPDGVYTMLQYSYQDVYANPVATTSTGTFTVDTVTQPCTILLPAADTEIDAIFNVTFKLGENAQGTTEGLQLQFVADLVYTLELATAVKAGGVWHSFSVNSENPTSSFAVASGDVVPLGGYTVILRYKDAVGNAAYTCSVAGVSIEAASASPQLISPPSNSQYSDTMLIRYKLRSNLTNSSDALQLVFEGSQHSYALAFHPIAHSPIGVELQFVVDLLSLTTAPNVSSVTGGNVLLEDVYTVTLCADSLDFGVVGKDDSINVRIDRTTLPPDVASPITTDETAEAYEDLVPLVFELPEAPYANSTRVTILDTASPSHSIVYAVTGSSRNCVALLRVIANVFSVVHTNCPMALQQVPAFTFAWPATLNVSVAYQDQYSNPVASTTVPHVVVTGNKTANGTAVVSVSGDDVYARDSRVFFGKGRFDVTTTALLVGGVFVYVCATMTAALLVYANGSYQRLLEQDAGSTKALEVVVNSAKVMCHVAVLYVLYETHEEDRTGIDHENAVLPWVVVTGTIALLGEAMLRTTMNSFQTTVFNSFVFVAFVSMAAFSMVGKGPGIVAIGAASCVAAAVAVPQYFAESRAFLLSMSWVGLLVITAANYNT